MPDPIVIIDSSDEDELDMLGSSRPHASGSSRTQTQVNRRRSSEAVSAASLAAGPSSVVAAATGTQTAPSSSSNTRDASSQPHRGSTEALSRPQAHNRGPVQLEVSSADEDEESEEEAEVQHQLVQAERRPEVITLTDTSDIEEEPTPPPAERPAPALTTGNEASVASPNDAEQSNSPDELAMNVGLPPRTTSAQQSPPRPPVNRPASSSTGTPKPVKPTSNLSQTLHSRENDLEATPRPRLSQPALSTTGRRIPFKKQFGVQASPEKHALPLQKAPSTSPKKSGAKPAHPSPKTSRMRATSELEIMIISDDDDEEEQSVPAPPLQQVAARMETQGDQSAEISPPPFRPIDEALPFSSDQRERLTAAAPQLPLPSTIVLHGSWTAEAESARRPSPFLFSPSPRSVSERLATRSSEPPTVHRNSLQRSRTASVTGTDDEVDQRETDTEAGAASPLAESSVFGAGDEEDEEQVDQEGEQQEGLVNMDVDGDLESSDDESVTGVNSADNGKGEALAEDSEGEGSTTSRSLQAAEDLLSSRAESSMDNSPQPDRSRSLSSRPQSPAQSTNSASTNAIKPISALGVIPVARKSSGSPTITRKSSGGSGLATINSVVAPPVHRLTARKSSASTTARFAAGAAPKPPIRGRLKGHASASASTSGSSKRRNLELADCVDLTMSSDEEAERAAQAMGAIPEEDLESSDDEVAPALTTTTHLSDESIATIAEAQGTGAGAAQASRAETVVKRARASKNLSDIALSNSSTAWTAQDGPRKRISGPTQAANKPSRLPLVKPALPPSSNRIVDLAQVAPDAEQQHYIDDENVSYHPPTVEMEEGDISSDEEPLEPEEAAALELSRAKFFAEERKVRACYRKIAGPSFPSEFQETLDLVRLLRDRNLRFSMLNDGDTLEDPADTRIYEELIAQANFAEMPGDPADLPRVRIIPSIADEPPFSPPWELCYTNRIVYTGRFVPEQSPGCGCDGNCGSAENIGTCKCRRRQERACMTKHQLKEPYPRSGSRGFAYTPNGLLREELRNTKDPVWECNSACGCDSSCINRVVGKVPKTPIDIIHTGRKGWAIRNPPSYTYELWEGDDPRHYEGRVIPKGTALGIYAAELISHKAGRIRDSQLYSEISRNYIYGIDTTSVLEDLRLSLPDLATTTPSYHQSMDEYLAANPPAPRSSKPIDDADLPSIDQVKSQVDLDAFHYGNWTRFANHSCENFNAEVRPVYVDEGHVGRPLFVFFAIKDIHPGEEIAITYYGDPPPPLKPYESLKRYQEGAAARREQADPSWRCYCGDALCRGVMFNAFTDDGPNEFVDG